MHQLYNIVRLSFLLFVTISVSFCNFSKSKKESEKQQKTPSSIADSTQYSSTDSNKSDVLIHTHSNGLFRYDLDNPDERYPLPKYLNEISGLAYYTENKILCVQDEKADIYILSVTKREILNKYSFGKDGDYEDVAIIGQTAYVIRNDGRIFKIEDFDTKNRKVTDHKTPLSENNDTEGLAYDKTSSSLFIACKGSPAVGKENQYKGYKAIYQFDLIEMKLNKKPFILIESEKNFQPSGIAINPVNDHIYLISSADKILVILDRQGKVLDLQDLDPEIFIQPEGICFSPAGDMFISNEGIGGKGNILRFNHRNDK